jgi:hypothetical protein
MSFKTEKYLDLNKSNGRLEADNSESYDNEEKFP